jgi:hypothetical protein
MESPNLAKTELLAFRAPPEQKAQIVQAARQKHMRQAEYIRQAVMRQVEADAKG